VQYFHSQSLSTDVGKQSDKLNNQLKPSILQTFGDIANAIGTHFETYLTVVAQVLQQAAGVSVAPDVSFDMLDYILSLREGIMDAWGGILLAFKETAKGMSKALRGARNMLIPDSQPAPGLCRAHFHTSTNDCSGSKPKRRPAPSFNGCYWVR
jgi:importin subunit beta-1